MTTAIVSEDTVFHDLNLSEKYVPNWGVWEIGREIISNAIDADPSGYSVEPINENLLRVFTNTAPTLSQLKVIGHGSKAADGETIGHFGEGFKLAALAAVRGGGNIEVLTEKFIAKFGLRAMDELFSERVLFMETRTPSSPLSLGGCEIYISFPGISKAVEGKFLRDRNPGPIDKKDGRLLNVFLRGVHVQAIEQKSLFDWNVNDVEINRDRSIVNVWQLTSRVANWLSRNMNEDLAEKLLRALPGSFELEAMDKWPENFDARAKKILKAKFIELNGADVVFATDNATANKLSAAKGKKVLVLDQGIIRTIKADLSFPEGILDSEQFTKKTASFTHIPAKDEWKDAIEEINQVLDLLGIPAEINVFENFLGAELGLAVLRPEKDGCTVWLNEKLFLPGYRRERISTAIHELSHIRDGQGDGTIEFEKSLDIVAGELAIAWLDKGK